MTDMDTGVEEDTDTGEMVEPSLSVSDQTADPADEVSVDEVVSNGPGWLVIHEADGDSFGAVIGQTMVQDGTNSDVSVTLDRDAEDGETLYAMLHDDMPEDGNYTFDGSNGEDPPVANSDGDVVVQSFVVSVDGGMGTTPSVTVSDQTADPANEVSVGEVVSDGQGWIVIHEQNQAGDSFGAVIGQTMVSDGTNEDVTVELDRDATDGETLYAMLHEDNPEDGDYTFDGMNGEDPPVSVNNSVVVETFVVSVDGGMGTTPSVTVSDQTADPANEVNVGEVVSDGQGWIVIHEENEAGDSFGGVIGQTMVSDGTNSDVSVTLDRDATDGETLYAMLHDDSPEDGNYTFDGMNGEDPPVSVDNSVVVETFVVSVDGGGVTPSVTVTDQTASPLDEVVVDEVVSDGQGWIVIHEEDGGSFGAVIGQTMVSDGTNTDVSVTLDRDITDGETLYAMLHDDSPEDGNYTFDGMNGEDPPVSVNNNVVVETFVASE